MATQVVFNGRAFGWADASFPLFGREVTGIERVEYGYDHEKEDMILAGNTASYRGYGNIVMRPGTLVLLMDEVEWITAGLAGKRITELPGFPFPIVFESGNRVVKHTLENVEFTGNGREVRQGSKVISVELPIIYSNIIGL